MDSKKFSQEELNRIVTLRVKRERERLAKEFENKIKRCMASIHLMLHQEMCAIKRDAAAETQDTLYPDLQPNEAAQPVPSCKKQSVGGESQ